MNCLSQKHKINLSLNDWGTSNVVFDYKPIIQFEQNLQKQKFILQNNIKQLSNIPKQLYSKLDSYLKILIQIIGSKKLQQTGLLISLQGAFDNYFKAQLLFILKQSKYQSKIYYNYGDNELIYYESQGEFKECLMKMSDIFIVQNQQFQDYLQQILQEKQIQSNHQISKTEIQQDLEQNMTNSAIAYKELKYVINEINIKYEKLDNLFREIQMDIFKEKQNI